MIGMSRFDGPHNPISNRDRRLNLVYDKEFVAATVLKSNDKTHPKAALLYEQAHGCASPSSFYLFFHAPAFASSAIFSDPFRGG